MLLEEFSLEDFIDVRVQEGIEQGIGQGIERGKATGRKEGEQRLLTLNSLLIAENKLEDLVRVTMDEAFREEMLKKYQL